MPGGAVCIDGELFAAASASVSVFDRGFLYGDGAFEVMRTYGGAPFREKEHLVRLTKSCQRLLIPFPISLPELAGEVARTLEASGLCESYVRVVITRGVGPVGLDISSAQEPSRVVYALPLKTLPDQAYECGVAVALASPSLLSAAPLHAPAYAQGPVDAGKARRPGNAPGVVTGRAKSSNYLPNLLAVHDVKLRDCHEAILVGQFGEIVEGASSNLFVVRRGNLLTPPRESGILEGITRATVIEIALDMGIEVSETTLFPSDLYAADEVFITSSIREIVPVTTVDGLVVGNGRPGPLSTDLLRAYRRLAWASACRSVHPGQEPVG